MKLLFGMSRQRYPSIGPQPYFQLIICELFYQYDDSVALLQE